MMQLTIIGSDKRPIWLVDPSYTIGRAEHCDLRLQDARLQAIHARLEVDGDRVTLMPEDGAPVAVNGKPLSGNCLLKHDDRVVLGISQLQLVDPKVTVQSASRDRAEAPRGWALQGLSTALSEKRYTLKDSMLVGRARDCDICLGVAHLSRHHARLSMTGGTLVVEDLNSANGTYVNGNRVERVALKGGDELRFDTLRFRVVGAATSTEAADLDKTSVRPALAGIAPGKQETAKPTQQTRRKPAVQPEVSGAEPSVASPPAKKLLFWPLLAGVSATSKAWSNLAG